MYMKLSSNFAFIEVYNSFMKNIIQQFQTILSVTDRLTEHKHAFTDNQKNLSQRDLSLYLLAKSTIF